MSLFSQYGLLHWFLRLARSFAAISRFASCGAASIAQVHDFQQALVQGFDKDGWAGLCVLPETGHAEEDVVGLWVVTGAVAIGNHWAVAAEHFYSGRDLETEDR